ncbi:MAG: GtrA family protein [Acidobacteriota bacterium]
MRTPSFVSRVLTGSTDSLLLQMARYVIVGGAAFVLDFSTLFLLTHYLGIYYLVSAAISFLLGLVLNYLLSITWVFSRRNMKDQRAEFVVFALIGVAGLGLNELVLWLFTGLIGFNYLVSKCLSGVIVLMWNFSARKLSLFR